MNENDVRSHHVAKRTTLVLLIHFDLSLVEISAFWQLNEMGFIS